MTNNLKSEKNNKLEELLKLYKEIKECSFIIANINKDFFFEICDCLIERINELEKLKEEK